MPAACDALLTCTTAQVTEQDILDFSPHDPGYPNYVRILTDILLTRRLPSKSGSRFDVAEAVNVALFRLAPDNPPRLRRFRCFTSAVALSLLAGGDDTGHTAPNYLPIALIDDARHLQAHQFFTRLPHAFEECRTAITGPFPEESPYFLLAQLLLHFVAGVPADPSRLADKLIAADSEPHDGPEFLWSYTNYTHLHPLWKSYVREWLPSTPPPLGLLKAFLLDDHPR